MVNKKKLEKDLSHLSNDDLPLDLTVGNKKIVIIDAGDIQRLRNTAIKARTRLANPTYRIRSPLSSFDSRLIMHHHHRINPKG